MTAPQVLRTRAIKRPNLGFGSPADYQDAATTATNAAASQGREDLSVDVGQRLGGLASIGALRSGGAAAGVRDATKIYSGKVANAAAANALEAARMGQSDTQLASQQKFAAGESAAQRGSTEKIAGNQLGFQREQLGQQATQFGQDLGFRGQQLASTEKVAGLEIGSREKMAADTLAFQRQGLTSDEARAAAQLQYQKDVSAQQNTQFESNLGFQGKQLAQQGSQFEQNLGFQNTALQTQADLQRNQQAEQQREFNLERQDQLQAAAQKKKSGLFGFIGKALGVVAGFIPGASLVTGALNALAPSEGSAGSQGGA